MNDYQSHPEYSRAYGEIQSGQPRYEVIGRLISQAGLDNVTANGMVDQIEAQLRGGSQANYGGGQPSYGGQQQSGYGGQPNNAQLEELRRQLNNKGVGKLVLGIILIIVGIVATIIAFEAGYVAGLTIIIIVYGVINLIRGISMMSKASQLR